MAAEENSPGPDGGNLLDELLAQAREQYVEEHGEEPPDEFLEEARTRILRRLAKKGRDEHRDVYDALAEE
jgi:hypothetical protein